MSLKVITVASGGLPVVNVTVTNPSIGLPVVEAAAGQGGIMVTQVPALGLPVNYRANPEVEEGA